MNPITSRLEFEKQMMEGMYKLRQEKAAKDIETVKNLLEQQENILRTLCADMIQNRDDEDKLDHVRRLQQEILVMITCLNESRKQRESIHIWSSA